ncbi:MULTISPECIES: ATP-dependent DNA helicase UvrD2 [Micromonospora]|uniref:DNA 3'-5' helicase n=1 Tax=Micromonospora chalcea TaxID=1874 RepID=A0ABX9Y4Q5_MICCH|nr:MULTISPECIES: ATP-dependent DNA helicase UvrD2 [Micromonospora]EWM67674.1 ATP-dependent DNA helicase [Micromonospora sp. M42]MBP1785481.1 DNA helicase-2/ATP-dependent DNA helicase PcrA [Micromonospora sp. HB375]MBQ1060278.1 ATP-dependent DNA helicase UvrD2 [Micromonospora sp. C41]MCK1808010.1 ATP-dependent DNA helicase UvrD2 [Micromonospora sp. R42106]MCK1835387.1 ATP-dependent DNA helicase UvrD2 [Micromonospora sp. R42003]
MGVHSGAERVLAGLDPEQRSAVTAPAGPVCILAGAGTGKTRAVTSRIAYRALTGDIAGRHVLAVTFTARAAAEMRSRLTVLGVQGVQARTFHAAALRQVRYFAPRLLAGRAMPELLDSKVRVVTLAAAKVGLRADRAAARDLAAEIEWAKSSLVEPGEYVVAAAKALRETPYEPARVADVFDAYERLKRGNGVIDFEDMLRAAVWGIEEHPDVAEQVRNQYRHFVVDEYQDVNPLQQRLLEAWLGGRDDLTVVGDASQTIYSFTGATSSYLVDFPRLHRGATVVRLVRDYRSTPQVVGLANAVISQARGTEARLRLELHGQRRPGPEPELRIFTDEPAEANAVAARCRALVAGGTPAREIAVLFRTNAQSEAYEKALSEAGVPYVLQGAERFFERPEVRQAMIALRAATRSASVDTPLPAAVVEGLSAVGWAPDAPPPGGAARERWEALAALVQLAEEYAADAEAEPGLTGFTEELARRAAQQHVPTVEGVTLASLHSAKGLEWDAVFLVGLAEGTLPTTYAKTMEQVEEERRLLYVGITRAREWLWLSYATARSPGGRARRPSRFLPQLDRSGGGERAGGGGPARRAERRRPQVVSCRICGATLLAGADRKLGRCPTCPSDIDEELYERLRDWRQRVAGAQKVPAYVVFTDATLTALAERKPGRTEELVAIAGIGPRKVGLYGDTVLALVAGATVDEVCSQKTSEN